MLRFDDPGNIVYGVMAREPFLDVTRAEIVGHMGAGVAQLMDNVKPEDLDFEVLSYYATGFDDPRDYEAVELGYDYYDKLFRH